MFPNVRLMIVAIFASVVGISCGLGLFAAFRVNREPFAHSPNGGPSLPLVFATPAPATAAAAPSFGVRFQLPQTAAAAGRDVNQSIQQDAAKSGAAEVVVVTPADQSADATLTAAKAGNKRRRVVKVSPVPQQQGDAAAQPAYQWAEWATDQAAQTGQSRVAAKHRRSPEKATAQTAAPQQTIGPSLAPAVR
jgi:hypothetical protein